METDMDTEIEQSTPLFLEDFMRKETERRENAVVDVSDLADLTVSSVLSFFGKIETWPLPVVYLAGK